ncbi:MAG: hypothetical protein HOM11_02765, partial [Methylococcales bacterium]|nr:hypothetical protein [Methylococcales bacterium]
MTTLLIDADILVYKAAYKFEYTWQGEAMADEQGAYLYVDHTINQWMNTLGGTDAISCLSDSDNWRKSLFPDYKANRKQQKPMLYTAVRQYISQNKKKCIRPQLEADDILGILATSEDIIPGDKIVISSDKDLNTVPCYLFNPDKDRAPKLVTEEAAHRYHMLQTLMGDSTDNYKGCPGVGPKKANQYLDCVDHEDYWFAVEAVFRCFGQCENSALLNARLAKILTCKDYDFTKKTVKLWQPVFSNSGMSLKDAY